jgi:peptidoglycan biosynthesis protein MviN/MurJ (putative lipid II flippase)
MSIARAFSYSLLLLAASRLLGVVRDAVVATQFGLSGHADAALVALSYPDFTVSLLWGAAVPAVMVPRMAGRSAEFIAAEAARWSRFALAAFACAGFLSWLLQAPITHWLAPGLVGADAALAAHALGLAGLVALPAGAVTMVGAAALQAQGRLQWQYAGHVVFNLVLIGGLLVAAHWHQFGWITAGIAAAALARWLLIRRVSQPTRMPPSSAAVVAGGDSAWKEQNAAHPATSAPRNAGSLWPDAGGLRAAALALAASGLTVLYTLAARAFASDAGPGRLGVFHYAQRVGELPLNTLFAVAAALALARLSAAEAAGDAAGARERGRQWMQSMLLLAALLGACGMLAAPLGVRLVFGWGHMNAADQGEVIQSMRWILALLPLQAAQMVLAARLNSHRRIADQVLGYGCGLLALFAVGWWLPDVWWRALAAYGAAYLMATAVLWQRLGKQTDDFERRNGGLLLLSLGLLAPMGWGLDAAHASTSRMLMLPLALLAGLLFAAGMAALLRWDALGAEMGRKMLRRYTRS